MLLLHHNKRDHSMWYIIPMKDETHANMFANNDWVYALDGKKHGRIPAVVLPELIHIFGGEDTIRQAGYRKHWCVFRNTITDEYTFGNKPSFEKSSDPKEREYAKNMVVVNIEQLLQL